MGWTARNITAIRELGLGSLSVGCALAALGVGGDMTLTAIVLLTGWTLGSLAVVTLPSKTGRWRLIVAVSLGIFFLIEGGFLYWHFHERPSQRAVLSGVQFEKLQEIASFVGKKDEFQLQHLFDFPRLMARNVFMIKDMIRLRKRGKLNQFDITNYEESNRQLLLDFHGATQDSNGRYILKDNPNDLPGIVITDGYAKAKQKLLAFETSPLVPQSVIEKLKLLDGFTNDDLGILLDLLQEKSKQDDGYFLYENTPNSKYQNAIDNLFAERRKPLAPAASAVIEAIRQYLGTS